MIPLFDGATPPQEIITKIITEKPPAIVQQVEPSLEDKIKTNYYKCNTDIQWIRADNAQCLNKVTPTAQSPAITAENAPQGNTYEYRSCTWWVKQWKPSVGSWGNANNWGYAAQSNGWTVSSTPTVGAVAWTTRGTYGHVGLVVAVGSGTVTIQEGNYDWNGSVRTIDVPAETYQYIY